MPKRRWQYGHAQIADELLIEFEVDVSFEVVNLNPILKVDCKSNYRLNIKNVNVRLDDSQYDLA